MESFYRKKKHQNNKRQTNKVNHFLNITQQPKTRNR